MDITIYLQECEFSALNTAYPQGNHVNYSQVSILTRLLPLLHVESISANYTPYYRISSAHWEGFVCTL